MDRIVDTEPRPEAAAPNGLRLNLLARIGVAFGALLALFIASSMVGLGQLHQVLHLEQQQAELRRLEDAVVEWRAQTRLNVARAVASAKAGNPPALAQWMDGEMRQTSARISELQKTLEASLVEAEARALMAEVARQRKAYVDLRAGLLTKLADPAARDAAAAAIDAQMVPAAQGYLRALDAVDAHVSARVQAHAAAMATAGRRAGLVMPGAAALAVVAGLALAWAVTRNLVRPIRAATAAARRIAGGDLTRQVAVDRRDELGELQAALARMQDNLRAIVGDIRAGTESVSLATSQIAGGNQDLSARTERAASSLQQTAAALAALNDTMGQSLGSAREAHGLAGSAGEVARRGGEVVDQFVATMREIHEGSRRIADITGMIDGIAFQTNILALNAAVEAARAGEQGRGFAVVASEVRTLAARSAQAAREIKALIDSSTQQAQTGSRLAESAGSTMQAIETSVHDVTQAIAGISTATTGQVNGVDEIHQAVTQLDQITQSNAALVEEAAAAARSLSDQAGALARRVASFRLVPAAA